MTHKSSLTKTTAMVLAASIFAGGLLPVAQASAGHKQKHRAHSYHGGNHGVRQHPRRHKQRHTKRKRSNNGNLVAAGVIGLALGAIIASEASKNKRSSHNQYNRPAPQPSYQYDQYGQPYRAQRVPLDRYGNPAYQAPQRYNEPEVITYRDSASYEPWTPGWREWCSNRYRSFNVQTGTFRGYDGLDHFCVPK